MKKIILSTLLLSSIICGSNNVSELEQAIENSDFKALKTLLTKTTKDIKKPTIMAQRIISQRKHDLTHPMISDSYPILGKITIGGFLAALVSFVTFASKTQDKEKYSDSELCHGLASAAFSLATVASASLMVVNEAVQKGKLLYKLHKSVKIRDLLLKQQISNENQEMTA